jgi:hypothetical protein
MSLKPSGLGVFTFFHPSGEFRRETLETPECQLASERGVADMVFIILLRII